MSNSGIRMQDLILPLIAGGASAFSRPAARGIAVGLGALGGVMQQRQEQQRLSDALAAETQKESALRDSVLRSLDAAEASSNQPQSAAGLTGVPTRRYDPVQLKIARELANAGFAQRALDNFPKPISEDQEEVFAVSDDTSTRGIGRRSGREYYRIPLEKAPKPPSTSWRRGAKPNTEESVDESGKVYATRPVAPDQPPPEKPEKPQKLSDVDGNDALTVMSTGKPLILRDSEGKAFFFGPDQAKQWLEKRKEYGMSPMDAMFAGALGGGSPAAPAQKASPEQEAAAKGF